MRAFFFLFWYRRGHEQHASPGAVLACRGPSATSRLPCTMLDQDGQAGQPHAVQPHVAATARRGSLCTPRVLDALLVAEAEVEPPLMVELPPMPITSADTVTE
jgi:hypothetical protein